MYSETHKPGARQFFSGLFLMFAAYTVGFLLRGVIPNRVLLRAVITVLMYCAAVYVIYVRYTAVYTFTLGKKELTAHIRAGRRTEEVTVAYKKIDSVTRGRKHRIPLSRKTFISSVFRNRHCCNIAYNKGKNMLIIEVGDEFYNKLKEHIK